MIIEAGSFGATSYLRCVNVYSLVLYGLKTGISIIYAEKIIHD